MNIQAFIDGMGQQWQRERTASQMTLGSLIGVLEKLPPDVSVVNLVEPHSYRGYYCDLAFERAEGTRKVSDLLEECKNAMGRIFEGYKGGDFLMGENTPIWVAEYGCTGERIIEILPGGGIRVAPEDD